MSVNNRSISAATQTRNSLVHQVIQILNPLRPDQRGKGPRGTVSNFVPGSPPEYGQPHTQQIADPTGAIITPQRMREIVMKSPTASACLNAILDYAVSVPIKVRNANPALPADPDQLKHVQSFIDIPNGMDSNLHFKHKLFRDCVTMGTGIAEIEANMEGGVYALNVLDAARLWIDFDEAGRILGFDMLDIHGMPIRQADGVHAWKTSELLYFNCNPISDSAYSTSKVSQLFAAALIENLMLHFIGSRFTDSNVPYGLLDLGEVSELELQRAVELWNEQAEGPHQIVLTGSKGGAKWMPFAYALRDLEAEKLLKAIQSYIMQILGVTKNELGDSQDVSKSNGYNLSYTFKRRAIEPLLNEYCATMTKTLVWQRLGYLDIDLYYEEIDSRDQLLQAQIDKIYLDGGVWSINHVRNRQGEPNVEGGEEPKIVMSTGAVPVSLIDAFAAAQLQGLLAIVNQTNDPAAGAGGAGGQDSGVGKIQPGIIRPPQMPIRYGTPDARGSSGAKFSYNNPAPPSGSPQAARGPVQANRNAGNPPNNGKSTQK